jgi:hypothetical protein
MEKMPDTKEQTHNRHAIEMFTVANEYCLFIEKASEYTVDEILDFVLKISALLYLKGLVLPLTEPENTDALERYVNEEQYESVYNDLKAKFGTDDDFFFIDYAIPNEDNPVKGSLAEHYADIYQDLKDFVLLFSKGSVQAKENATAIVKQLFNNHWGPRLLSVQQALHFRLYDSDPGDQYLNF